ncbi:MAG: cytochrome P450 [Verrucomicrobiota bacterium]
MMKPPLSTHVSVPSHGASRVSQVLGLIRDVDQFLEAGMIDLGPVFSIRPLGVPEYVIVADSDLVADLHKMPEGVLTDYPANAFVEPLFGKNSVIFQDGEDHVRTREALMRLFREIELTTYLEVLEEEIDKGIDELVTANGEQFDIELGEFFRGCFRRANVRIVFGRGDWGEFEEMTDHLLDSLSTVSDMFRHHWACSLRWTDSRRTRRDIDGLIREQWKKVRSGNHVAGSHTSAIELLAKAEASSPVFSLEALCDLLFSMFLTGYIPPGATAAWSLGHILEDAMVEREVFEEIESEGGRTPLLDSVFFEVLRWHNPLPFTSRTVARECEAGGRRWPVGTRFMISSFLIHRFDPMWDRADEFNAKRFQEIPMALSCRGFIPFGGGAHRCLGMHMAPVLNRHCLASFLSKTGSDLELLDSMAEGSRFYAGTALPSGPIRVRVIVKKNVAKASSDGTLGVVGGPGKEAGA